MQFTLPFFYGPIEKDQQIKEHLYIYIYIYEEKRKMSTNCAMKGVWNNSMLWTVELLAPLNSQTNFEEPKDNLQQKYVLIARR